MVATRRGGTSRADGEGTGPQHSGSRSVEDGLDNGIENRAVNTQNGQVSSGHTWPQKSSKRVHLQVTEGPSTSAEHLMTKDELEARTRSNTEPVAKRLRDRDSVKRSRLGRAEDGCVDGAQQRVDETETGHTDRKGSSSEDETVRKGGDVEARDGEYNRYGRRLRNVQAIVPDYVDDSEFARRTRKRVSKRTQRINKRPQPSTSHRYETRRSAKECKYSLRARRKSFTIHDSEGEEFPQKDATEESEDSSKEGLEHDGEEGNEEEEEEEEEEQEEEEDPTTGRRYELRDRSRMLKLSDRIPQHRSVRMPARKRAKTDVRRANKWKSRSARHGRSSFFHYDSDDDSIPDEEAGTWKALRGPSWTQAGGPSVPWQQPGAAPEATAQAAKSLDVPAREQKGNAEITPVQVDPSVSFSDIGGLDHYIRSLKEMIFLPLVYPELFERFHINPPRGVLFYGPPGTGKTLVARALAATASRAGRKVAFFMRKGADVLSKWVGESERQLRLLFEEAVRQQPSIIFFDEIDGLAPVRSSKQDQIHNSIVSTLLALMDGLDSRGKVVVIGATNRIDAVDGALRRPGRFDRELLFPLPNLKARQQILEIHCRKWSRPPSADLAAQVSQMCVGYCGADMKALCTEACLHALRRHYPQIYDSDAKLLVDPSRVNVDPQDFMAAYSLITPASHRAAAAHARPLPPVVSPLLSPQLQIVLDQLQMIMPPLTAIINNQEGDQHSTTAAAGGMAPRALLAQGGLSASCMQRPRLLLCGQEGAGQNHLGPALLHAIEGLPVHAIGLPSLLSDAGARCPEEALVHSLVEARRCAPAVLFLPHLQLWWDTAPASLRATLWCLLSDLPPELPLLLFATADVTVDELPAEARALFGAFGGGVYTIQPPTRSHRMEFFKDLCMSLAMPPDPAKDKAQQVQPPPPLPVAPEAVAAAEEAERAQREQAQHEAYEEDQSVLRALRMLLREITTKLLCDRRWRMFAEPVSPEEDPQYWDKVQQPMDLASLLCNVDEGMYSTPTQFMSDVGLIVEATKQYLADDPSAVRDISRAHALKDEAQSLVSARIPLQLVHKCQEIEAKGGPLPPPDGHPAAQLHGVVQSVAAAGGVGGAPHGGPDGAPPRQFTRTRSRHHVGDLTPLMHKDPDAEARRIREQKRMKEKALEAVQEAGGPMPEEDNAPEQPTQTEVPDEAPLPQYHPGLPQANGTESITGGASSDMEVDEAANQQHNAGPQQQAVEVHPIVDQAAPREPDMQRVPAQCDVDGAMELCSHLATATHAFTVEGLEVLHSQLSRVVIEHEHNQQRQQAIQAARKVFTNFMSTIGA